MEHIREVTTTPQLNMNSLRMVSQSSYNGPVSGWTEHFKKFCAKRSAPMPVNMFTPNINANASRVNSHENIADRLYTDSFIRREKKIQMAKERRIQELIDPATGRHFFEPQSLGSPQGSAAGTTSQEALTSQLHEDSKIIQLRKEQLRKKYDDHELTFSPAINKNSSVLAEKKRRPLYSPRRSKSADAVPDDETTKKVLKPHEVAEFLRRLEKNDVSRESRLNSLAQVKESQELSECSFHPQISKKSEEIFERTNLYSTPVDTPAPRTVDTSHTSLKKASHGGTEASPSISMPPRAISNPSQYASQSRPQPPTAADSAIRSNN